MMKKISRRSFVLSAGVEFAVLADASKRASACAIHSAGSDPMFEIVGDWQIRVNKGTIQIGEHGGHVTVHEPATLNIDHAVSIETSGENWENLPMYDAKAAPWGRGARLRQLDTYETTAADMLVPESVVIHGSNGEQLRLHEDYELEPKWATVGFIAGSNAAGKPVTIDYTCGWGRIDSIVVNSHGNVTLRMGIAHRATPEPPALLSSSGEKRIANIWVPGRTSKLTSDSIYQITEPVYPEKRHNKKPVAATLLPKTWEKITRGQPFNVMAWGDSVTAGGQASDASHQYQSVFIAKLKARYPASNPTLTTVGWGGRNTDSFLNEPPGAEYNFEKAVIAPKPDLILMEFVNDAYMTPEVVEKKYSYLLERFKQIGAELVIITPHFVRPDWMGATSVRVETDPLPYTTGVRQFCEAHNVAIADASLRWGHLVKEGIPYVTLLSNSINHPNDHGHEMFAAAIMELFL